MGVGGGGWGSCGAEQDGWVAVVGSNAVLGWADPQGPAFDAILHAILHVYPSQMASHSQAFALLTSP